MVRQLAVQLDEWRGDAAVERVVVSAAGGRAFSAGGDLRHIYEARRTGREEDAIAFWRDEYALNAAIKAYPKPYVALVDGLVMGGGVGVSVHGSHVVAGDQFRFAMPEAGIGFFPDVGATWFLPRLPGEIGTYCALTGDRMGAADAAATGLATHRVASPRLSALADALCAVGSIEHIVSDFAEATHLADDGERGPITAHRDEIDRIFAANSVEFILAELDTEAQSEDSHVAAKTWAAATAAAIRAKAPLSLKIALAQMRRGRAWPFEECLRAEFRIASRVVYGHDFYEGIRAVIVDKDNRPQWRPATLAGVADALVEQHFAPLATELALP